MQMAWIQQAVGWAGYPAAISRHQEHSSEVVRPFEPILIPDSQIAMLCHGPMYKAPVCVRMSSGGRSINSDSKHYYGILGAAAQTAVSVADV